MSDVTVAAVDLGASSGRVMLGRVGPDHLDLEEVGRFTNTPVRVLDTLHWDVLALYRGVLDGLRAAGRRVRPASIGIDSWAVDYGLLDDDGALLGNPVHHRDGRTDGVVERVVADLGAERLYATTGVQQLPINTLFQLAAASGTAQLRAARRLLMIPDLLTHWLTGHEGAEVTNASTTQLLDVGRRTWAPDLVAALDLPSHLLPAVHEPGTTTGSLLPAVQQRLGIDGAPVPVTAVGTHDTASAVVGVPMTTSRAAYISCGTWSLVGLELDGPILSPASREANFTNELGVDHTVRYLRNVMGLWLLQESERIWRDQGRDIELTELLDAAADAPALRTLVDPDDARFLPPGDQPDRIAAVARETGQPVPTDPGAVTRCILDSLALAYRRTVRQAAELADREVEVVHVVGGGAHNALLCQFTADACDLPVVAGPVEATALGNVLVQGRALGAVGGDLGDLRARIRDAYRLITYEPRGVGPWEDAERRVFG